MSTKHHSQPANLLWSVADLLRGYFKQSEYGRIIRPFTLLKIDVRSWKARSSHIAYGESTPTRAAA